MIEGLEDVQDFEWGIRWHRTDKKRAKNVEVLLFFFFEELMASSITCRLNSALHTVPIT